MKKIVKLNPKFFTKCVDDCVVPIRSVTNKEIEKALQEIFEKGVVIRTEPDIVIKNGVKKDEI